MNWLRILFFAALIFVQPAVNTWLTFTSALPAKLAQFPVGADTPRRLCPFITALDRAGA
jgi:hypothetical protein